MSDTATAFANWIDTFVEEKGLDIHHYFAVQGEQWGTNLIPLEAVIETAKITHPREQYLIRRQLIQLDFCNADPMKYFAHLAARMAL